jgi:hypothetical protein
VVLQASIGFPITYKILLILTYTPPDLTNTPLLSDYFQVILGDSRPITNILLYTARVFRWKRTGHVPGTVKYLSRVVLEHARSIRKFSTAQKQLLLPVFLAAAETQNEDYRQFARDYCDWWTKSCGYKMFADVSSYLEDLWHEQDNYNEPGIWWATIIDRRKKGSQQGRLPQILMG